jgi:nucleotide-binding universal stress UspA family protein
MTTTTAPTTSEQQWQFETPAIGGMVVGFDGSPASYAAVRSASVIAAVNGWSAHVVSILPAMSSYKLNLGIDEPQSEIESLRIQLRDAAIRDAIGCDCDEAGWSHEVVIGKPAEEIARIADDRGANLIILGRSQRGMVDRLLGIDTTIQVMGCSSVPVLIVDDDLDKPSVAVVAVDFRKASARAASIALQMLGRRGILYLVHVEEPLSVFPDGPISQPEPYSGETFFLFRKLLAQLRIPSEVLVETIVLNGVPVPAIEEFCERVGADMLAVGTHGLPRIARAVVGSVSRGLIRKVHLPILIAPAKG